MTLFRLNSSLLRATRPLAQQNRRNMGHGIKKHIRVEENAGLREKQYMSWEITPSIFLEMLAYLFVPFGLVYYYGVREAEIRDEQIGRPRRYGIMIPKDLR